MRLHLALLCAVHCWHFSSLHVADASKPEKKGKGKGKSADAVMKELDESKVTVDPAIDVPAPGVLSTSMTTTSLAFQSGFLQKLLSVALVYVVTRVVCLVARKPKHQVSARSSIAAGADTLPSAASGNRACDLLKQFEEFNGLVRSRFLLGSQRVADEDFRQCLEEALAFARVICEGLAQFPCSVELRRSDSTDPSLIVRPQQPLSGELATRSRVPFNMCVDDEVCFALRCNPPEGECPFRCKCHAHCFGPASSANAAGDPTGGPWAELTIEFADGAKQTFDCGSQVFKGDADLSEVVGAQVVHVSRNDFRSVTLQGCVAVITEKHKPNTKSDGALVREALAAGACCVVKVGGGGSMLFCVPDPLEIPCLAITEEAGTSLISKLARPARVVQILRHDRRGRLQQERWTSGMVWLELKGMYLHTVDHDSPISGLARRSVSSRGPLIYEDYSEFYLARKDKDDELSPRRSKLRRVLESAWSQLGKIGVRNNPAMLGKLLALGSQRGKFTLDYVKFAPAKTFAGTSCTMLISQVDASELQAWMAHEMVYLALMSYFAKMMEFVAPSLWNFLLCINGEFFGWEADSTKIRKLFTPCKGPVGPQPKESWQKLDPTWCIVDEKNMVGMVTKTQGRILWSQASGRPATADLQSETRKVQEGRGALRALGHLCFGACAFDLR
eukprot:TRINITY_DN62226_c0_g1_i1.p1 TRINITY_DN62226_c0_g1~~TRINITY_DN62226_c0_g1_i1.p1  ORF type:complete len:674 (+),score=119.24 TRINITY_DN62226_c0_g1_i1:80-2101(+)